MNIISSTKITSETTDSLKFISFGSGSNGNCYYLYNKKESLMVDAGVGLRTLKKRFFESGISFSGIHNVVITHDHADHVKCTGSLAKTPTTQFYATADVHKGIDKNYGVKKKIPEGQKMFITKNVPFKIGGFEIVAFNVPHDSTDCVGYSITYNTMTLCIITDAGDVTEEMKTHISNADFLIIEANHNTAMLSSGRYPQMLKSRVMGNSGHLSNADCAKAIAENATARLRHVWLCHLSGENNTPEIAFNDINTYLKEHNITVGENFKLDILMRTGMSKVYDLEV